MADNAVSAKPGGKPVVNASNTKQHQLMARGENPKIETGKQTRP